MLFAWAITISSNTLEAAPKTQELKLTYGTVTRVTFKFPAGCHGLVHVKLLHEESVLVPLNKDTWLAGDDENVDCDVFFGLTASPFTLKFVGCSPSAGYAHEILVRATVLDPSVATPYQVIADLVNIFKRLLGVAS